MKIATGRESVSAPFHRQISGEVKSIWLHRENDESVNWPTWTGETKLTDCQTKDDQAQSWLVFSVRKKHNTSVSVQWSGVSKHCGSLLSSGGFWSWGTWVEKYFIILSFHWRQSCKESPVCGFKVPLWHVLSLSFQEIRSDKVKCFDYTKEKWQKSEERTGLKSLSWETLMI